MSSHKATRRARRVPWWKSVKVRAVLSLGVVLGFGATSTMASWSDTATAETGSFTAGTLNLKLGDPAVDNDPPAFTTGFTLDNMVPGSTKDAVLRISNAGSVPFTFTASGSATNSNAGDDQMGAAIRISVFGSNESGACVGSAIAGPVTVNGAILPPQGALANGTFRDLCFRATLPAGAHSDLQGKSTILTLTFTADQVAP